MGACRGKQSLLGRPEGKALCLGFERPEAPEPRSQCLLSPPRRSGATPLPSSLPGLRSQLASGCRPVPAEGTQTGRAGRGTPGPSQPTPRGSPAQ